MKEILQQAASSVTSNPVGGATAITVSAGWATIWQIVPGFLGACSCIVGMYVTIYLFRQKREINKLIIMEKKVRTDES